MRLRVAVLLVIAESSALHAASVPLPVGSQFQVNSYTTSQQSFPAVSRAANGDFVVVWQSLGSSGSDSSSYSVQGQRYASGGAAQGGQFQVNAYTTLSQSSPAVSRAAGGDFAVVWHSVGSSDGDSSGYSVQGQRYASGGAAQGGQFQVNTYTTNYQSFPAVALDAAGDFVVVWDSLAADGDSSISSVQGQRYASGGAPQGGQFQVNAYTPYAQRDAAVARAASGDFVVVWSSNGSSGGDTSGYSVHGQRYAAGGGVSGGEFQVNTFSFGSQFSPAVARAAAGDFVVVWASGLSSGGDTSGYSVLGQRYAAGGAAQGAEFQVNSYTTSNQFYAAVSSDADGDFVVVWQSFGSSGTDSLGDSVQGQRYASGGAALGGQFQVNSYTLSNQRVPVVALDADGDFVVVWQSDGSGGTDSLLTSVQGQRFRVTGDLQGKAFFDQDSDGVQDGGEPGIAGITVELYDSTPVLRRMALTDANGDYFLKPKEGSWHLKFVAPLGYNLTLQDAGGDDTLDSDADPATGETDSFAVTIDTLDTTVDAGFTPLIFADGFESHDTTAWSSTVP